MAKENVSKILESAAKLVEKNWVRNYLACTSMGTPVEPTDPRAEKFCAVGSIRQAGKDEDVRIVREALAALRQELLEATKVSSLSIEGWNDHYCKNGYELAEHMRSAARKVAQ